MTTPLVEGLARFTDPRNESQLRELDELVGALDLEDCGEPEIRALLEVFERFPDEDGYGVFWSILHCLEKCRGYEPLLLDSVARAPVEFNLNMINRLLNSGVSELGGHRLLSILEEAATSDKASFSTKKLARNFIEYQRGRNTRLIRDGEVPFRSLGRD